MEGMRAYHIDEGYSEHPMVQDEQVADMVNPESSEMLALDAHALGLGEEARAEHIYRMLVTLRTSTIASIVERLTPRLRMDPVVQLPPEIISQIFSYLSPDVLMVASTVSKAWRAETLETSLWRRKFVDEGWYLNISKVLRFERERGRASVRKPLSRRAASDNDSREHKRRAVSPAKSAANTIPWSEVADSGSVSTTSQSVQANELSSPTDVHSPLLERLNTTYSTMSDDLRNLRIPASNRSLMIKTPNGDSRLDYHRLYSIKSQLEENWTQGRYAAFQFPHPDHQNEAHTECVYTIQFSDKYLVSGSRDRTIRIWDLDTFRLVKKPLRGHGGSVLSLQFDDAADEDLIVSGSSDKSIGIWQFSTGEMSRRITDQHTEAVLCVRFDRRYLASCSKDRLIKVFNRQPLRPGDDDYPIRGAKGGGSFPDYIIDMSYFGTVVDFERYLTPEQKQPLEPYTLIMTLQHHSGAVNSLHIHDDRLASGSGDRTSKIFNLRTGVVLTNCHAHNKGVACIEYDGARLVSGSSDETIRIFDPATNAEVGKLDGHSKLVRTIQVDFADAPGARETLEEDALLADQAFLDAQNGDSMLFSPNSLGRRERETTQYSQTFQLPASNHHRRATTPLYNVIGAKLPPGGGGNRWSRIVSGSYDETVLVWRREPDGRWVIGQRYKVADVLRTAGPPLVAESDLAVIQQRARRAGRVPPVIAQAPAVPQGDQRAMHGADLNAPQSTVGTSLTTQIVGNTGDDANASGAAAAAASQAAATHQGLGSMPAITSHLVHSHQQQQQQVQPYMNLSNNITRQLDTQPQPYPLTHLQIPGAHGLPQTGLQTAVTGPPREDTAAPQVVTIPGPLANQVNNTAAAAAAVAAFQAHTGSARAFKLQFDARRIICCSQDPKIVGWDFAAGNPEIIEAAKFFTRTSHYARGG